MYKVRIIRNDKGDIISGIRELENEAFGTGKYKNGEPEVNWKLLSKYADRHGFDIRRLINHTEYTEMIFLPVNTIILRYGSEIGMFSAPKGTKYEELALPYKKETVEYNEYKVIKQKVPVIKCRVEKGYVAPGFNSPGGGIQYLHDRPIYELLRKHLIERL